MSLTGDTAALDTMRLRGYSIRVSNSSNILPNSTDPCFTDISSGVLPTVIEKDCEKTTRYVWFFQTNKRGHADTAPILEICEVQVFGKLTRCDTLYIPMVFNIKY